MAKSVPAAPAAPSVTECASAPERKPSDPAEVNEAPAIKMLAESLQVVFGQNFRAKRLEAGLTQAAAAKAAGMQRPDVTAIESGTGNVTLKTMERLARVVGCRVEVLLTPIDGR